MVMICVFGCMYYDKLLKVFMNIKWIDWMSVVIDVCSCVFGVDSF